jgi:hypothetical protein
MAPGAGSLWYLLASPGSTDGGVEDGSGAVDAGTEEVTLVRWSEASGAAQVVATGSGSTDGSGFERLLVSQILFRNPLLVVSGGDAFFSLGSSVAVVRAGSSAFETLASESQNVVAVGADDSYVYWSANGQGWVFCGGFLGKCPPQPTTTPYLRRVPRAGGPVETIASTALTAFTAGSGSVWGAEQGQSGDVLVRYDANGTRTILAGGMGGITGVAVDATSVYWTVQGLGTGGRLLRTRR